MTTPVEWPRAEWREHRSYELLGTYLELRPTAVGAWVIVDVRKPDESLDSALTLANAKRRAVRMVQFNQKLVKR